MFPASMDRSTLTFCLILVGVGLFHIILPGVARACWNALYQLRLSLWQSRGGWQFDPDRPERQSMTSSLWYYRIMGLALLAFTALIFYYSR